jgi:hypothetical protein
MSSTARAESGSPALLRGEMNDRLSLQLPQAGRLANGAA